MPLLDQFGKPLQTGRGGPSLKPKAKKYLPPPKNIPRKPRFSEAGKLSASQERTKHVMVEVTLFAAHHINGIDYGSRTQVTKVTVPKHIADALMEAEQRAARADADFNQTKAVLVGPGHNGGLKANRVAPEYFDAGELSAVPLGVVSKQGVFTNY